MFAPGNDENQRNVVTPQRFNNRLNENSPYGNHASSGAKSLLLSGAKRIPMVAMKLPSDPAINPLAVKSEKNHYMKPTEAFQ
jgi:hypothetical protein